LASSGSFSPIDSSLTTGNGAAVDGGDAGL
jgi:hypothetical protein